MKNALKEFGILLIVSVIINTGIFLVFNKFGNPKPTQKTVSGMHYEIIEGNIANITIDSLECLLLQSAIIKEQKNLMFYPKNK